MLNVFNNYKLIRYLIYKMSTKSQNINNRIKELDNVIYQLKQKLTAMIWERDKYLQFSNKKNNEIDPSAHL